VADRVILFAWRRLPPPGFIGGAEISEGLIAAALVEHGEDVTFVGSTFHPRDWSDSWRPWLLHLLEHHGIPHQTLGNGIAYDWRGVHCHAVPQEDLLTTVRRHAQSARVLWTSQEDCLAVRQAAGDPPTASYAHSVSAVGLLSAQIGAEWVFAPSRFVRDVIQQRFGQVSHVMRPPVASVAALSSADAREGVLFVNPIKLKGVDLALELARCLPETPFVFVESWGPVGLNEDDLALPDNVRLLPRQPSLAPFYARAQLLVVPSIVEDACPRVILEAAAAGVPALGSALGGIPELIANPSNLLPPTDIGAWTRRADEILQSPREWTHASEQQHAFAASLRQDLDGVLNAAGYPLASRL
jgi:glycosyltransferase involved in cell wall biosynthesis